jgi:acyl CoA:acetate/3-ketoacid CoA transferase beta subunit
MIDSIITDLGVIDVAPEGSKIVELAKGVTKECLQSKMRRLICFGLLISDSFIQLDSY